ncbi:hypothetical protein IPJ72_06655 [Candidatus Peregrinibacteria bacterium]|nr:MAG: hypothetical protein IPJ72_06655 [Candidatus Peregrinibacteria bacterium]
MKHTKKHPILQWIKDVSLKALGILLVVGGGFYAYAQIAWPASDPNPVTGVVGTFVGESSQTYSSAKDYPTVNDYCNLSGDPNMAGSHICTPMEMINSYNHANVNSPINTYATSNTLWVNGGGQANDCGGWTQTTSTPTQPQYGTVWNFNTDESNLLTCRTGKAFACCK